MNKVITKSSVISSAKYSDPTSRTQFLARLQKANLANTPHKFLNIGSFLGLVPVSGNIKSNYTNC
jgi:hypothetical protein